jgi:thymidine kinase
MSLQSEFFFEENTSVESDGDIPEENIQLNIQTENTLVDTVGTLQLIIGPMFSGKTTMLIHQLTKYADMGWRVLYINHSDDNRETEIKKGDVTTHNSSFSGLSSKIVSMKTDCLSTIDVSDFDWIGVDESQFFSDLKTVLIWINKKQKNVICSGLDGDSNRDPIGSILTLVPQCNIVNKINSGCKLCKTVLDPPRFTEAPFTAHNGIQTSQKEVGGEDLYSPMCRYHHNIHINGSRKDYHITDHSSKYKDENLSRVNNINNLNKSINNSLLVDILREDKTICIIGCIGIFLLLTM